MFIPSITPESLLQDIICRMIGPRVVDAKAINDTFKDLPSLLRVVNVVFSPNSGQIVTNHELNSAMNELLSALDRKVDDNLDLNELQKGVLKLANMNFVSMVYDAILSRLRIVAVL